MYATAWFCDGEAPSQAPPIPVPRVVERGADDTAAWLVTEAVPGVAAAEEWPEHQRFAVVEAMAEPMEKRQQRGLFTVPGLLLAFCSHVLSCVIP